MSKKKIKRPQKYQKKADPTFKEWWAQQSAKTQWAIKGIAIAVVVVILALIVWYNFIYDDGSLKVRNDALVDAQDNWLVADLGDGKNSEYYKIATVDTPEGYVLSDEDVDGTSTAVDLRTSFVFKPVDEDSPLNYVYVLGIAKTPQEMVEQAHNALGSMVGEDGSITDITDYKTEKGTARYFSYQMVYESEDGSGVMKYTQAMAFYMPTGYKGTSVLISVNCAPESAEGFVEENVLLAAVEDVLPCVTANGR